MLQVIESLKLTSPTPVQHSAIPVIMEGKDVVAIAQTGTGKTLAFGIPIVQLLIQSGGQALVLAPTRDLCLQIDEVFQDILHPFQMKSSVLVGGLRMGNQISQLRRKPQVIIATPGRLIDHIERRTVQLDRVNIFILDEADRMLDMGFAPQVSRIIQRLPQQRQTALFSATMPENIIKLSKQYMKAPTRVEVARPAMTLKETTQELFIVANENKKSLLRALLKTYAGSVLIFIRTKHNTKKITHYLQQVGHAAVEIHSNRTMGQRKNAIEGFKKGRYRILVATDVAARGLDVKDIEVVINYDLPDEIENYVHRIGRTGRAGQKGRAITFATPDQGQGVRDIERLIKHSIPRGVHENAKEEQFRKGAAQPPHRGRRHRFRSRGRRF